MRDEQQRQIAVRYLTQIFSPSIFEGFCESRQSHEAREAGIARARDFAEGLVDKVLPVWGQIFNEE